MISPSRLRGMIRQLLHLDESPHRTALAFAIGVFITFSPPYGLHMIMALASVWIFRLNTVAVLAGFCLNTPWTLIPVLGFNLWIGCLLTSLPFPTTLTWSDTSLSGIVVTLAPYAVPFIIGSTLFSLATALAAYPLAHWLLLRFRHQHRKEGPSPLPESRDIG